MSELDQDIFEKVWQDLLDEHQALAKNTNPKGYVLGGQPGAGKSNAIDRIVDELNGNVLIINGDDFRRYHHDFETIQQQYDKDASKYTAQFAGEITNRIIERSIQEKYNVAIEGTFRTAETPLKTLQDLKANGYQTNVYIQTTSKDVSWQSTLDRYDAMKRAGISPRYTPKEHHDLVVELLPTNADRVFDSGLADNLKVFSRDALLFDKNVNVNEKPSLSIGRELQNELTISKNSSLSTELPIAMLKQSSKKNGFSR
jgi:UDP-N-acetylglucosamine kinase